MLSFLESIGCQLFFINLICLYILLIGILWSILIPKKRLWPPPKKNSWQYILTWFIFYMVFALNLVFIPIDWNSWILTSSLRVFLAWPLIIVGSLIFLWGFLTLGLKNTSGVRDQCITKGPYRYTRNPQYLGDSLLFIGLTILANSIYLFLSTILLILIFILTSWAEEKWLEEQYGEVYRQYKNSTPRFL